MFVRLHVTAEGRTEERFVKQVLCPHLGNANVSADVRSVLTSKDRRAHREYRGGLKTYDRARQDIATWLKEDSKPDARFTTMFDLYGLPDDFPGSAEAARVADPYEKVALLERALDTDVADSRFVSYIQLHEFEALILAQPKMLLEEYFERETEVQDLLKVLANHHNNPELIDDGPATAPSKRILRQIPEYDKATAGPDLAARIGIDHLRQRCHHFGDWLRKLEGLTATPAVERS